MHLQFLGLSGAHASYRQARVILVPVPYEYTVTFGRGAGRGPETAIAASVQIETYDEYFGCETFRPALHTLAPLAVNAPPESMVRCVKEQVRRILQDGKKPLLIGGEHTVTLGAVEACVERFPNLSVLSIDAHADLRDTYQGRRVSHATVMRRVSERCPVRVVAVRSISPEELRYASQRPERVSIFFRHTLRPLGQHLQQLCRSLGPLLYVSLDVDALDLGLMPACGNPEPGGLDWFELTELLEAVSSAGTIVGADVVEFAPAPEDLTIGSVTARIIQRVLGFVAREKDGGARQEPTAPQ